MVFITINSLHVTGGFSAHHQELKTVYKTMGICWAFSVFTAIVSEFELTHDSGKTQEKLDKYPMLRIQFWAPDDGQRSCLKHVEHL